MSSFCQTPAQIDSAGIGRTVGLFLKSVGENAPIYNGAAYAGYEKGIIGSPFFESDHLSNGTVFYAGVRYDNVQIAYDLVSDCLILKDFQNENLQIILVTEKIDSFIVNDHVFVNGNGSGKEGNKTGFLERVYNGAHTVLIKRRKQVEARPLEEKDKSIFAEYDYYLVMQQSAFTPVSSASDLLKLFANKKALVKIYLKEHQLKFKKNPEKTIVEAARYYDSLAN